MQTISNDLLKEIVRHLVTPFQPEQIILFGSHAWGVPNEDSDLDLLVVVSDSDVKVSKDILIKTRAEVERFRNVRASLESEILERGKVLYG